MGKSPNDICLEMKGDLTGLICVLTGVNVNLTWGLKTRVVGSIDIIRRETRVQNVKLIIKLIFKIILVFLFFRFYRAWYGVTPQQKKPDNLKFFVSVALIIKPEYFDDCRIDS